MMNLSAETQYFEARKLIRKQHKSTVDRLKSIALDARFVDSVLDIFGLPAVCNERCGRWYVKPERLAGSAYFKSTDGHTDHCKFSLRRLNLHLLPFIQQHGGVILVDSTRRGKRMPDALSKTVPIWCCVMNRTANILLKKNWTAQQLALMVPSKVVSASEQSKISDAIDGWVRSFITTGITAESFDATDMPLRPLWITPDSRLGGGGESDRFKDADFFPVVLVTASKCVPDGIERQNGFHYIQGAADDEEMWSMGLTSHVFHQFQESILSLHSDEEIARFVASHDPLPEPETSTMTRIRGTRLVLTDRLDAPNQSHLIIDLSVIPQWTTTTTASSYLHIPLPHGKRASHPLLAAFAAIESFITTDDTIRITKDIIMTDDEHCSSKAPVVALFLLTLFYDDKDREIPRLAHVTKEIIQKRLVTLSASRPGININRASLKSLNEYLMSERYKS